MPVYHPKPTDPVGPKVYNYTKIYKLKREKRLKKKEEEETSRKFTFKAKPVPNYIKKTKPTIQAISPKKKLKFTVPMTPQVFKKSRELAINRQKLLIESIRNMKPYTFKSHEAIVLHREPFKPLKSERCLTSFRPFTLHSADRGEVRRVFDAETRKHNEQKEEIDREKKLRDEEELSRLFREQIHFKANPNPFK